MEILHIKQMHFCIILKHRQLKLQ